MYNCFNAFSSGKYLSERLGFASGRVNSGVASAIPSCIKVIFACGAITKQNIAALSSLGYCWLCFAMRIVIAIKNWMQKLIWKFGCNFFWQLAYKQCLTWHEDESIFTSWVEVLDIWSTTTSNYFIGFWYNTFQHIFSICGKTISKSIQRSWTTVSLKYSIIIVL